MEVITDNFSERKLFLSRFILFLTMVYTLVLPVLKVKSAEPDKYSANSGNGIGGGLTAEQIGFIQDIEENNPEILGIPEPEEFSRPKLLVYDSYIVEKGDTISAIAVSTGLNEDTLLSVNQIKNSRLLQIGQILKIPNQDGLSYIVGNDDTLFSISEKYEIDPQAIKTVNELFSDSISEKISLFIPGARMDWVNKQEINGDLFIWPVTGYITSSYGYREDPFGRGVQFHNGLDIGVPLGTVIRAAMAGRVTSTGFNDSYGNYLIISHHSGYRTMYAHLSVISVKSGAYVAAGERIGLAGSTGLSTGPHLHFTVYKDGVTVNPRSLMK